MSQLILRKSALAAVAASLICSVGLARADHNPPVPPNMNFNEVEPPQYPECENANYKVDIEVYSACIKSVDAARIMAQSYGGGHGRVEGYLYGFSHALNKTAPAYMGDPEATAAAETFVGGIGSQMESGFAAGVAQAKKDADSQGRSDAIKRFEAVLNTGNNPDPTVVTPATNYQGIDNGFDLMQGQIAGVVNRDAEGILRNDLSGIADLKVYHTWDAQTLGEMKPVSVWDLWFSDPNGLYKFERYGWYDKDAAISMWLKLPGYSKPAYNNLANIKIQKKNANGTPMVDATGAPVYYNLQAEIFQKAFKEAYAYYVNYHYSKSFGVAANDGALNGEMVGIQLGKRLAYYSAMKRAFNAKFKESSKVAYNNGFSGSYGKAFSDVFTDYNTKPHLSVSIESVIGALDDGILQPGEEFALQLIVKNLGGVPTSLNTTVGGNSVTEPKAEQHEIAKISSKRITTQIMGRINPTMQSGQMADIDVMMNGAQMASTNPQVMNQLQIDQNVAIGVTATEGSVTAGVTVRNMSTMTAPEVAIALSINGKVTQVIKLGNIASLSAASAQLSAEGIDPLQIINGQITAKVVASKQDRAMDEETRAIKVNSAIDEIALYFDKLINGKGFVPANTDRDSRTGEVQAIIVRENEAETRELRSGHPNLYKKAPGQTVVGKMVERKKANYQSGAAVDRYDAMAKQMYPARKNLKKIFGIFKSGKRKHYEELCKDLSKDGNLD